MPIPPLLSRDAVATPVGASNPRSTGAAGTIPAGGVRESPATATSPATVYRSAT